MQSTVAGREQPQQCECWTSEFFFDGFTNKRPPRRTRATGTVPDNGHAPSSAAHASYIALPNAPGPT